MEIRYRRLNDYIPEPRFQSPGAVAFDLCAREEVTITEGEHLLVPTGLIVEVPQGCALLIAARSSLFMKHGVLVANGVGVIDQDYHGPGDEVMVSLYKPGKSLYYTTTIIAGERIAQGLIVPVACGPSVELREVCMELSGVSRGGFGSTGR